MRGAPKSALSPDLRRALDRIARDSERGAAELASAAARAIRRELRRARFRSGSEAGTWAHDAAAALLAVQPQMAPFYHLASALLRAVDVGPGKGPLTELRRVPERFLRDAAAHAQSAAHCAARLVPDGGTVLTYSRSGSVLEALRAALQMGRRWTVRVSEGRPRGEGRSVARSALALGHRVEFFTDAALFAAVPGADAVLLGADALAESKFRNKVGTGALALVAREARVAVYVIADPFKVLPERYWLPELPRPAGEVWRLRRKGLSIPNLYFEAVPLTLVTGVVLGTGAADVYTPGALSRWFAPELFRPVEKLLAG
ncbi:MAG: hypothetical protein HY702_06025 [Gemmatimonadetes bacterium]|nr:hypothetical protein [Gemmatimonadota bacterium]